MLGKLPTVELEIEQGRDADNFRRGEYLVTQGGLNLLDMGIGPFNFPQPGRGHFDVRENPVEAIFHLADETRHHAVHDNQSRHAKRNADNRSQGDKPRPEVSPG